MRYRGARKPLRKKHVPVSCSMRTMPRGRKGESSFILLAGREKATGDLGDPTTTMRCQGSCLIHSFTPAKGYLRVRRERDDQTILAHCALHHGHSLQTIIKHIVSICFMRYAYCKRQPKCHDHSIISKPPITGRSASLTEKMDSDA